MPDPSRKRPPTNPAPEPSPLGSPDRRHLTDDPEQRHTEGGIARAMFGVAVSGRREQEPSFHTVIEVVAEEVGSSLRWATATTTRTTRSSSE